MAKTLFSILLIAASSGVGLALAAAWMHFRVWQLTKVAAELDTILVKLGIALTQGILVVRLLQLTSTDPTWYGWGYALGLMTLTVGLARQIRTAIEVLVLAKDVKK